MIRSLCTADWQIGMKATHAGEKAKVVRQKRFETAGRIVELAKQKDVDFVLLASDTFKHHNVDSAAMKRTVDTLPRPDPTGSTTCPVETGSAGSDVLAEDRCTPREEESREMAGAGIVSMNPKRKD